jgi:aminoglycoside phosphotransferase (APT) family kinase protein
MGRGVPLAIRDEATRAALAELADDIDTGAAIAVWEDALAAAEWDGPPRWIHGDLHPGNLLVRGGRLTAVIDFGALAAGDPACDLMAAWTYLDAGSRKVFREHLRATDADWSRGRGWALSVTAIALPYYRDSNPILAGIARRTLAEILG